MTYPVQTQFVIECIKKSKSEQAGELLDLALRAHHYVADFSKIPETMCDEIREYAGDLMKHGFFKLPNDPLLLQISVGTEYSDDIVTTYSLITEIESGKFAVYDFVRWPSIGIKIAQNPVMAVAEISKENQWGWGSCNFKYDEALWGPLKKTLAQHEGQNYIELLGQPYVPVPMLISDVAETAKISVSDHEDFMERNADGGVGNFFNFIALINTDGILLKNYKAPALTNKMRAKKGKPQVHAHTRVFIDPKILRPQKNDGGSHASPRLHWRRGHIRRLKTGKTTFVRACLVGDKSGGMIAKTYELRGVIA